MVNTQDDIFNVIDLGMNSVSPRVTVAIVVYNDERLLQCLQSLQKQTVGNDIFRVLVVENGSNKAYELCNAYGAMYIHLKKPSIPDARNKVIECAQGEFILFTDSDCVPSSNWVESHVNFLDRHPRVGVLGGPVRSFRPLTPVQQYGGTLVDGQEELPRLSHISPFPYAVTANAAFRYQALIEVGGFDTQLLSGSDVDVAWRLIAKGWEIAHCNEAFIEHQERETITQHFRRFVRYSFYQVLLFRKYREVTGKRVLINDYPALCAKRAFDFFIHGIPLLLKGSREPLWHSGLLIVEGLGVLTGNTLGAIRFCVPYLPSPIVFRMSSSAASKSDPSNGTTGTEQ